MGQSGRSLRGNKNEQDGDDVKKQVDSDDSHEKPIYQLVNVKNGGGILLDIIKTRAKTSSSSSFGTSATTHKSFDLTQSLHDDDEVNKQIRQLVEPLLYENGKGKIVPLSCLWDWRFGKSSGEDGNKSSVEDYNVSPEMVSKDPSNYRWVCWKLEERGHVGETGLHICFLLSTPTHMILAQKLLAIFPMLINDVYTSDGYFGESSLHMSIVNEDVKIVKLLLSHGANVHERCLGSFFLPTDQKDKTNGLVRRTLERSRTILDGGNLESLEALELQSNHFSSSKTNYDGYAYWGEYPLSFAACLGLTDCYKILLAKGANPNLQDSNGNTTLHLTVIANRIDMFDLCYSTGADLNLVNKQNLTPLTLAAKLRKVEMFFHILAIKRRIDWVFCEVGFVKFPLNGVDSIDTFNGTCNENSVLSIVVFGASNEHLEMLNGLLAQLLTVKWNAFIKENLFLGFIFMATIAYITRFDSFNNQLTRTNTLQTQLGSYKHGDYLNIGPISELSIVLSSIYYLMITFRRLATNSSFILLFRSLSQAPELFMFSLTCLLILACIPLRLLNWRQSEDFLAALIMFSIPLKFLFFCRASRSVGPFIVMIYRILVNDVLCFVVFLIIFVAGFSQSFLIIFRTHRVSDSSRLTNTTITDKNYFVNLFDGIISMHMMALNEFTTVFDEFDSTDYPILAKILFCIYMVLASILLINMLIAMLGKTYQDIASQPNENLRQWARALLIVERMCSKQERMKMLDRYSDDELRSNSNSVCCRYYNSTWALEPEDMAKINSLKQLDADNKTASRRLNKQQQNCHLQPIIQMTSTVRSKAR